MSSVIPPPGASQQLVSAQATSAGPAAWRQAFQPNWGEFQPFAAFYCLPGILGILIAGLLSGNTMPAQVAASGALAVGFGAFQVQFRHPRTPMIAVTIGASISAGIGTLANAWLPVEALCTTLWGIGVGLMNLIAPGPGWLALQGAIALVIAASFPATPRFAFYRFLLVLGGATFQLCVILTLRTIAPKPFDAMRYQQPASVTVASVLRQAFDIVAGRRAGFGHALTAGLAVTLGDLLAHWLQMPNGYWIAMTVLLVLRPDMRETATRVATRLAGTVLGVGLVTLLTALLRPPPPWLVVLIGLATWSCYAFMRVNYALLSFGVTSYAVLLLALAGLPEPVVALDRMIATTLGGGIALAAHLLYLWVERWYRSSSRGGRTQG